MKNCYCEPAGGPLYCPVHNPKPRLREAFAEFGSAANASADSLLAYGRALAKE